MITKNKFNFVPVFSKNFLLNRKSLKSYTLLILNSYCFYTQSSHYFRLGYTSVYLLSFICLALYKEALTIRPPPLD